MAAPRSVEPLGMEEMEALPPLSPTMERAFSEAFAGLEELEESSGAITKEASEPSASSSPWTPPPASLSPADPASATPEREWQDDVTHMSPNQSNKTTASRADEAEAKRARRSAIEKKSRQRRQGVLRRMRDEVVRLEREYAEKLQDQSKHGKNNMATSGVEDLGRQYSQLSLVAHALEEDQVALQKLLQQYELFQRTAASQSKQSLDQDKPVNSAVIFDTGVPRSSSFTAKFQRLSVSECYAIVRETFEIVQRFDEGDRFESTGASFMGWTDKRKYDRQTEALQYGFAKAFPLESAEGLLLRTWNIFCDPESMMRMSFDSSASMRFHVIQKVNDDLVIVRRDHRLPNVPMTFLTVHMIFRLQTPKGFTLCMRTIPAPEIKSALEPHEYYYNVFHWTHFNYLYDENGHPAGSEIVTGGSIEDTQQLISKFWLFELMMSVLRWENACVAPLFLKHT